MNKLKKSSEKVKEDEIFIIDKFTQDDHDKENILLDFKEMDNY